MRIIGFGAETLVGKEGEDEARASRLATAYGPGPDTFAVSAAVGLYQPDPTGHPEIERGVSPMRMIRAPIRRR